MRPPNWKPLVELSSAEQKVVKRIRKAKLFVFLREIRHQLFNNEFQEELATFFTRQYCRKMSNSPSPISLSHNPASLHRGIG